jgi:hypothetical protein
MQFNDFEVLPIQRAKIFYVIISVFIPEIISCHIDVDLSASSY